MSDTIHRTVFVRPVPNYHYQRGIGFPLTYGAAVEDKHANFNETKLTTIKNIGSPLLFYVDI